MAPRMRVLGTLLQAAAGLHMLEAPAPAPASRAWIYGFGRSGTTSVYQLILEGLGVEDVSQGSTDDVFGLFEPCHRGDMAHFTNCTEELEALLRCDFQNIKRLQFWGLPHENIVAHKQKYQPQLAHDLCERASAHVIKTIAMHELREDALPLLDRFPDLRIVNIVRDPHGIYWSSKEQNMVTHSWQEMDPKTTVWYQREEGRFGPDKGREEPDPEVAYAYITYMCRSMLKMAAQPPHERLLTIRFEDLSLLKSAQTTADIFRFLSLPSGPEKIGKRVLGKSWSRPDMSEQEIMGYMRKMNHYGANFTRRERDALGTDECKKMMRAWGYA